MSALANNLTDKQYALVKHLARGVPIESASLLAGYTSEVEGYRQRRLPHVQAAIVAELRRFLVTEAGPIAIGILFSFARDEALDKKLRAACAKTVADRAGFIAPKAQESNGLDRKTLVDMTAAELRQASQDILKELSDRTTVVIDNAPQPVPDAPYPFDMLD